MNYDVKKLKMDFEKEYYFLNKSKDDSLELIFRLQLNIEKMADDILNIISSEKPQFYYDKLTLLGESGFDPDLLKVLRKFGILRNKFAHYEVGMPIQLDEKLLMPVIDSLGSDTKYLKQMYLQRLKNIDRNFFKSEVKCQFDSLTNTILNDMIVENVKFTFRIKYGSRMINE